MYFLSLNVKVKAYIYDTFIGDGAYVRIAVGVFVWHSIANSLLCRCVNCLLSVHGINLFLFWERTIVTFLYDCNRRRSSENVVVGNKGSCPHVCPLPCHSVSLTPTLRPSRRICPEVMAVEVIWHIVSCFVPALREDKWVSEWRTCRALCRSHLHVTSLCHDYTEKNF